jgi:hypothetical protein
VLARFEEGEATAPDVLVERMAAAATDAPLLASRLNGRWWTASTAPGVMVVGPGDPLESAPLHPFDLRHEPPLRVVTSARRDWLLLAGHHFAFDGLGLVSVLRSLLSGTSAPAPDYASGNADSRSLVPTLRRLWRPADPVAPSLINPRSDSFASAPAVLSRPGVTAGLARACAAAVSAHNAAAGKPLRRIGISVAVGGVGGAGATYRRVDVSAVDDVEPAVRAAMADPAVPPESKRLPPGASFVLKPVLPRFSDTILVSNLGRLDLPLVRGLEFYPVARGRSAVSVGAAGLDDGPTTLTLRSGNLSPSDAGALLSRVVSGLPTRSDGRREAPGGIPAGGRVSPVSRSNRRNNRVRADPARAGQENDAAVNGCEPLQVLYLELLCDVGFDTSSLPGEAAHVEVPDQA